jgi:hypothetical protein
VTTQNPSGEILGLDQSIAYAEQLAQLAAEHAPAGNEGYLAHLAAAHVDGPALASAQRMQAAFAAAQAAAAQHAAELARQKGVQEQYDANPDAGDKDYQQADAGAAAQPAPPAGPYRIANGRGRDTEYDPATGTAFEYQSDGERAELRAGVPAAIGAQLLYMREEIKTDRGVTFTDDQARALLQGLSGEQLRQVAAEIGAAPGSTVRTRTQLADHIVKMSVSAARKYSGLRRR